MKIKLFKKWDAVVIAAVIAFALIFIILSKSDSERVTAKISVGGELYTQIDLSAINEKIIITPNDEYNVRIIAEKGEIRFENSDCEDKLCVNTGSLKKSGDIAVCIPSKTVIEIIGSDVDAVVY